MSVVTRKASDHRACRAIIAHLRPARLVTNPARP
jgi:hypothetical protein